MIETLAESSPKKTGKGKMKMRELSVRKLDDGSILISCSYEGNEKYERKESSYGSAEEAGKAVMKFLKAGSGLAER